jgi:hypothetical protein
VELWLKANLQLMRSPQSTVGSGKKTASYTMSKGIQMTEAKNNNTDNQDDDEFALEFKTIGWLSNLILGKLKKLWPDWRCTQTLSPKTRPVRKAKRLRGQKVEPIEHYGFHTPFEVKTDGQQWIISTNTKVTVNRIAAMMLLFFFIFCTVALYFTYPAKGAELFIFLASILGLAALYNIIKARLGGEDTWVIFDRTTGNVCFWRKNAKNSLTVPFEQVDCYWTPVFRRGLSHNFYFMPTVNLPNERHRWWQVYMGFPTQYQQAQYFWRVLTDFMDKTKPIPSVPGLYHHLRWLEKNNYTLHDITEGGKEVAEADFVEIDEEMEKEIDAIDKEFEKMLHQPRGFNVDAIINFYIVSPDYAKDAMLISIRSTIKFRIRCLTKQNLMDMGFSKHFTLAEYRRDLNKLIQFFGPIINDISASHNSKEESSYIKLDVLDEA